MKEFKVFKKRYEELLLMEVSELEQYKSKIEQVDSSDAEYLDQLDRIISQYKNIYAH